jgi:hypothetical protein
MTLGSNNEAAKYGTRPRVPINEPKNNKQPPRHILTVAPIASIVKKGTSEVNLDLPTEFNSLFNSIKSGVQTGVKSAVKAGSNLQHHRSDDMFNTYFLFQVRIHESGLVWSLFPEIPVIFNGRMQ